MKKIVSKPIRFSVSDLESEFKRADLEFHGVDHAGLSFEARVFLNNPEADENTEKTEENGYAGSFYIFGHGGCFGDVGHCDVPTEPRQPFDKRPPHPLTPTKKRIIVTEALKKAAEKNPGEITVTVVPVIRGDQPDVKAVAKDVLKMERISIITYD